MTITSDTLYITFGRDNINKWADLDNDGDDATIANRIEYAITWAEAHFTSLVCKGRTLPVSPVVDDVIARLAGIWLYDSRGIAEEDAEKSPIAHHRKYCEKWMKAYLEQGVNFDKPLAPFIVP